MRTPILHMTKAQNSLSTPAGESRRNWRVYRPRQLAREGGGSAAVRVARLREYHVSDQHAEDRAGKRSLHRVVPFLPHRDSRVFIVRPMLTSIRLWRSSSMGKNLVSLEFLSPFFISRYSSMSARIRSTLVLLLDLVQVPDDDSP